MMWHYCKASVNGIEKVVKAHGRELQQRWRAPTTERNVLPAAGGPRDFPPFHTMPPQAGMPALETNHCFHVKSSPIVLETARCNNDVTPLLRFSNALLDLLRLDNDDADIEKAMCHISWKLLVVPNRVRDSFLRS